jgi:integrase
LDTTICLKRTSLKITQARIRGYRYFCVTCPKLGRGRTRRFFRDKRVAQTYLEQCRIQQENYGTAALSISDAMRVEAIECSEKLRAFSKTLRDATNFYVTHLQTTNRSRKTREVISELLNTRTRDGLSERYLADLRVRLARFSGVFGARLIATVTAGEIDDWLRSLGVGTVTRNTFRRRLIILFKFANGRGYLSENSMDHVERVKEHPGDVGILTVTETERLLECASFETLPYWAIGAFAGLRRAEIERLAWSEVNFDDAFIEVKAAKAKTASRRIVTIQENLLAWLAPYRLYTGHVCPANLQKKINDDRDRARLRLNWPQNALRHSFGSYHLARFNDSARLALEMGNSPAMIFKHYRELVKPKEAARYWEILPSTSEKVIPMMQAS